MEKEQDSSLIAPEEATTVGMFLKYTRQKQKKSVEEVSDALCIRKIYIKAIEEDNYKDLAPVPYGMGFVRSYAEYLGLNAERIVQCYKQQAMPKKEKLTPVAIKKHTALTIPTKRQIYFGLAGIIGLYLIWLIAYYTAASFSNTDEVLPNTSTESEVVVTEIEPTPQESEEQISVVEGDYVEEAKEEALEPEFHVVFKFKGRSWFEIKDNQKVYISGIFDKGFVYELPSVEGIIVSIGRYYNVDTYINDELVQVAGPKKQLDIELEPFLKH